LNARVLFVDDEPCVLDAIKRSLRKQVDMHTACSGSEGLQVLNDSGPFALVVSDMRMPIMTGAQFLAKVRERSPDAVRMILSGQADLQATIAAVNEGHIYRFLSKPCPAEQLLAAVEDGLNQHRLITAEKVLLEETLSGSIRTLVEILGMVSPATSTRASRLQRYVIQLPAALGLSERWEWGLSALLSQIGCVALPKELLSKVESGQRLNVDEKRLYESHPQVAEKLLAAIPRLDDVAAIVTAQFGDLNMGDTPEDLRAWDVRTMGRLLLRASIEFDRLICRGATCHAAAEALLGSNLKFPAFMQRPISELRVAGLERTIRQLCLSDLAVGMVLDEDLVSPKGIRLVPAGHEVTRSLIIRLMSIADGVGVTEPFRVRVYN
jgi:CheY-like chemotaxis protein